MLENQAQLANIVSMKNNDDQKFANTLITRTIKWKTLAAIAGMCLEHHKLAGDCVGEDSETLAEEIATQVAHQALKSGIDPTIAATHDSAETLNFTIPMWAVVFCCDIMTSLKESDSVFDFVLEYYVEFRPFAIAAVEILDDDGKGFGKDFPAHRLN